MTFQDFKTRIAQGLEKGEIKTDVDLTELDLAIQYAIGEEQTRRIKDNIKEDLILTIADIAALILKYCKKIIYFFIKTC